MCGRFSIVDGTTVIEKRFGVKFTTSEFETYYRANTKYNAGPSMSLPIIVRDESDDSGGETKLLVGKWGFLPPWMKTFRPQANARLETVAEKPMFRNAFKTRHCLVPANSFFEWNEDDKKKQPYLFHLKDNPLFAFAGIYEDSDMADQPPTFALMTTKANSLMAKIHHRMPFILQKEDEEKWLRSLGEGETLDIQTQYPADQMEMYPVTPKINKVSYQEPVAIELAVTAPQLF